MDTLQDLTENSFDQATSNPGITVVDFWASWCRPCRAMASHLRLAAELRPEYRFAKVDVETEGTLAERFGIASIPTLVVLRDGKPVAAQAGVIPAEQLVRALDRIATTSEEVAA